MRSNDFSKGCSGWGVQPIYLNALVLTAIAAHPCLSGADDAKAAFETGIEAFHQEDYPTALDAFERSYALRPMPKVLFNIAMCQKATYRYADALQTFREFMAESALSEDDPLYLEVATEMAELLTKVGHLNIVSTPPGATVRLDGALVGRAPVFPIPPVDPGTHTVELELEGFTSYQREVTVTAGDTLRLQVTMQIEQGTVDIRCPLNSRLIIDGQREEVCPFVGVLPAGSHNVTLTTPGAESVGKAFALSSGERLLLDISPTPTAWALDTDSAARTTLRRKSNTTMLVLGVVSTTLAAGAGALGAFFIVRGKRAYDDGLDAVKNGDKAEYDEINGQKLPAYRLGATTSFVSCGVFLAAGITLVTLSKQRRGLSRDVGSAVQIGFDSIRIRF